MRRFLLPVLLASALAAAGLAAAQGRPDEAAALLVAKRQAEEATRRYQQLESQAARATDEAAKARAAASAVAARIEAAEADLTAAETRIRIIEALRAQQRARLAERQGPVVRLTAALQTMARRPPALALIQPGSVDEVVHVRSLLASTLPIIRARTAGLRKEIRAGNALRSQAETARKALLDGQEELRRQRVAFARLEAEQRRRSEALSSSALVESDRALALGEEARDLAALVGTREYQARLRASLGALPGPLLRPTGEPGTPPPPRPRYILPVEGRILTGVGEISDAGVHARGMTFEAAAAAPVVAPRAGRVAYAGRFRGYGEVVIIEHGAGWTSVVTGLSALAVRAGQNVAMGAPLGRAAADARVSVELRRSGRPVPIAPLLG